MSDRTVLSNEEQYPWELDAWDEDRPARIRVRTLISGDKTPTSGIAMGVYELPPGAQLDLHHHHPQEVYYVTAGEAEVFTDGEWKPLRRGDVVFFPGDAVHGTRNRGSVACAIVFIFPTDTYAEIEYFED